jgi:hypothetical protein
MKAKEEKKWLERILSIMMYDIEKMQINVLTEIPRMEQIHECDTCPNVFYEDGVSIRI